MQTIESVSELEALYDVTVQGASTRYAITSRRFTDAGSALLDL